MNLRLRGPYGQATLSGIDEALDAGSFQDMLVVHTGVVVEDQEILTGYPPKLLEIPKSALNKSIELLGIEDGEMITVRVRSGGAAPSMAERGRSLSATRSLSRNSMRSSKSFSKNLSPSMQSLHEEADLSDKLMSTPLDAEDPLFGNASAFSPRPANGKTIGRSISSADVLGVDASHAKDYPLAEPDSKPPAAHASAPRRKRVAPGRAALGDDHHEGVPFGHRPQQEKPVTFGDWAQSEDPMCACVNCMLMRETDVSAASASARMDDHLVIVRRRVEDDNSCLFTSVGYIMEGFRSKGPQLRQVVAQEVANNPQEYNEAFLGKSPQEYAKWIQDPSKWGGAIELSILSKYYEREIAAYDIKTLRCDVYGEGSSYRERGMLIYDGLHYDALAIAAFENAPEEVDVSCFDPNGPQGEPAHRGAMEIIKQAQRDKQYTDTANFALRCQICNTGIRGESEALEHAKATGHGAFAEYNDTTGPGSPNARLRSSNSFSRGSRDSQRDSQRPVNAGM
ncbi:hypothetical protein WJX73_004057 [Symbiochloris irregularis]|uniref:Ubiquitin thioesterase OTU n=1 Tax=Symbiochloris irregularis TaxID=706552 RepID=A0AAW1NLF7_9CHLO